MLWHSLQSDISSIGGLLQVGCLKISSLPSSPCGCSAWREVPTSWGSHSRLASHPGTATGSSALGDCVQKKLPCPAQELSSQACPTWHPWEYQHRHPADPMQGWQHLQDGKKEWLGEFASNPALTAPVPCQRATPALVGQGRGRSLALGSCEIGL